VEFDKYLIQLFDIVFKFPQGNSVRRFLKETKAFDFIGDDYPASHFLEKTQ